MYLIYNRLGNRLGSQELGIPSLVNSATCLSAEGDMHFHRCCVEVKKKKKKI